MSNSKMREQFEAWYLAEYYEGSRECGLEWLSTEPCGDYLYADPALQWKVWQASRETMVIDLPNRRADDYPSEATRDAYNLAIDRCNDAIKAIGVKVKL